MKMKRRKRKRKRRKTIPIPIKQILLFERINWVNFISDSKNHEKIWGRLFPNKK